MAESTQSKHPWRASVRTGLNTLLLLLTALAVGMPEIVSFVRDQWPGSPAVQIVVTTSGIIVGLSILVNRLLLLPPVAALLQAIGLGPAPTGERAIILSETPEPIPIPDAEIPAPTIDDVVDIATLPDAETESVRRFLASKGWDRAQIQKLFDNE